MILLASALPFLQWIVDFIHWAKGMGPTGGVVYALFYIAGTALFFPGLPLTLGAGFLYGAVIGTLVVSPASVRSLSTIPTACKSDHCARVDTLSRVSVVQ